MELLTALNEAYLWFVALGRAILAQWDLLTQTTEAVWHTQWGAGCLILLGVIIFSKWAYGD